MKSQPKTNINERAQRLLTLLVERYIRDGQPVGSKTLAREPEISLSPASIRHIMADLESAGFLASPHTSAGRVPTARAYRFFADTLLGVHTFSEECVGDFDRALNPNVDTKTLVQSASALLSDFTHLAGVVTVPRRDRVTLRQVEFLPLSGNRILVILVLNQREVQNRVITMDRPYSASELQQAANYLTTHYAGKDLGMIRRNLLTALRDDQVEMERISRLIVQMADEAFADVAESANDYVVAGEAHLLQMADEASVEHLRSLFEAFSEKRDILNLLDHCLQAQGIQIYIGDESGYDALEECSVVTSPYTVDGKVVGVLGVIGPTRMDYDRAIHTVDMTAKLLSSALKEL